jgi:hypothetical protein
VDRSSSAPPRVRFSTIPKPGGVRVLARLEPGLARSYTSAVAAVTPAIEGALASGVIANRAWIVSEVPPRLVLRPLRRERDVLRRALRPMADGSLVLRTDVAECYRSTSPRAVRDALARCGAAPVAARRCARVLEELTDEGVEGLPIGPPASAVLANAVLAAGDAALASRGVGFVRWVDDWWIAVGSAVHAAEVLAGLAGALAPAGLRLSDAKTRIDPGPDGGGGSSGPGYHRAAHADPVPLVVDPDAVVPRDGGVGAGGRPARRTRGQR